MQPLSISVIFLCSILFGACTKETSKENEIPFITVPAPTDTNFTMYTITRGVHESTPNLPQWASVDSMVFDVRFDSDCRYLTVNPNNQADINKLFGFADNNMVHHAYSARIGWRWYQNKMELLGYIYNDSVRTYQFISQVPIEQNNRCVIAVHGNQYVFAVNGTRISMPRMASTARGYGYVLYPFFGGDEPAPQTMHIYIRRIR
ncbi:MAG: hypothetical protein ACK4HE_06445 [Chitinophagaceae bacterium]